MRGWFRSVTRTLPGGRARSSRARRPRRSSPTSGSRSTVAVLYAIRRIHDLRRTLISLARSDGAKKDILRLGTHGRDGDIMEAYTTLDWEALCLEVTKLRVERRKTANVIALPAGGLLTDFLQSREKARSNAGFESGGAGNRMGGFVPSVGTSRNAIPPPVRGRATSWLAGHADGGGNASAKPSGPRGESFCKTHAAGVPTFCKPTTRRTVRSGSASPTFAPPGSKGVARNLKAPCTGWDAWTPPPSSPPAFPSPCELLGTPGPPADPFPKLRVAGSNPVSRSSFRGDDEGFRGDPGALRLSWRREILARARCRFALPREDVGNSGVALSPRE